MGRMKVNKQEDGKMNVRYTTRDMVLGVKLYGYELTTKKGLNPKTHKQHVECDGSWWYWNMDGKLRRAKYGRPHLFAGLEIARIMGWEWEI